MFLLKSSLEKKSLLRDNVDILGSLADLYFRAGDNKNAILKFEQAQMLDPYLIKGTFLAALLRIACAFLHSTSLGFNVELAKPWPPS